MSTTSSPLAQGVSAVRTYLFVTGALALITGILILVWPGATALAVTAVVAVYAVIAGLVYIALGFTSKTKGGWSRIGHIVLGVIFVIGGIVAFANLGLATVQLAVFISVLLGILWLVEGIASLTTLGLAASKGWTVFFAIISIIAGISLITTPLAGAVSLWWLIGVSGIVLGIVNILRAISLRTAR